MSRWFIYFITRLDVLQVMERVMLTTGCIALMTAGFIFLYNICPPADKRLASIAKNVALRVLLPIVMVLSILLIATPSTKEMAAIYLIPKIVNNEQVQQLPNNALEFLTSEFRQWTKDVLSPESSTEDSD